MKATRKYIKEALIRFLNSALLYFDSGPAYLSTKNNTISIENIMAARLAI
jgi:hypothetical protein